MFTKEEIKEHRKVWAENLRSGKYNQGKTYLVDSNSNYCCLGVACEIMGLKKGDDGNSFVSYDGKELSSLVDETVINYFGLIDSFGTIKNKDNEIVILSILNDKGTSFNEIADIIENARV